MFLQHHQVPDHRSTTTHTHTHARARTQCRCACVVLLHQITNIFAAPLHDLPYKISNNLLYFFVP